MLRVSGRVFMPVLVLFLVFILFLVLFLKGMDTLYIPFQTVLSQKLDV